jgi:hypothetical protein
LLCLFFELSIAAISLRGVAIVVLPGDVALQEAASSRPSIPFEQSKVLVCPSIAEIARIFLYEPKHYENKELFRTLLAT